MKHAGSLYYTVTLNVITKGSVDTQVLEHKRRLQQRVKNQRKTLVEDLEWFNDA